MAAKSVRPTSLAMVFENRRNLENRRITCLARREEEREARAASVCPYSWLNSLFVITTWVIMRSLEREATTKKQ